MEQKIKQLGWIGRGEIAQELSVKKSTLAKWVKYELLKPVARHGRTQYFLRDEVQRFEEAYVTTLLAAQLLKVEPIVVQKWVRCGKLTSPIVVSGPSIDDCHAYRFDRVKLLEWHSERLSFGKTMQILGISKATLHRWVESGKIPAYQDIDGKQRWFNRNEILRITSSEV
jgi:excisionase family DNA binding protein